MASSQEPKSVSVVVPVYRAADCLEELHRRLIAVLEPLTTKIEILLVEDDGNGECWPVIRKIAAADKRVRGIRFGRNFGQHHAITAGLDHCDGDWVVVMDCDLQDPPEALPMMVAKAREGYSVVFARRATEQKSFGRRLTSRLFYRMLALVSPVKIDPATTNFSVISRDVVHILRGMRENLRFFGGMLVWLGFDFATVEIPYAERFAGTSSYSFFRRLRLAARNTFAYSNLPLIYSTFVGIGIAFIAFLAVIYFIIGYFVHGNAPQGWTSLVVALFFIGGFIIFQVGISGIYLGEVFNEVRQRPLYIVAETVGFEPDRRIYRSGRLPQDEA